MAQESPCANIYVRALSCFLCLIPVLPPGPTMPPAGKGTSCLGLRCRGDQVPVVLSRLYPGVPVPGRAPVSAAQGSCCVFGGINS